jgi:hypothetical protein
MLARAYTPVMVLFWDRLQMYAFRLFGALCVLALVTKVYKHGWQIDNIVTGLFLSTIMFSLGVAPERRNRGWVIRYLVAFVATAFLFVELLYRLLTT